jgi:hypothetical protein
MKMTAKHFSRAAVNTVRHPAAESRRDDGGVRVPMKEK